MEFGFIEHPLAGTPIGTALDLCIVLAAAAWQWFHWTGLGFIRTRDLMQA